MADGMRLYHSPASPFVRKVMVVLHETDLLGEVEIVSTSGTAIEPGTHPVGVNPLGKIPTLERPDGPALFDSRVICRYLVERTGAALYPAPPRLWETLTLEAMADGIMEASILIVYESRLRPEELRFSPWVEGQWSKIARALDTIESRWMSHLAGRLDMAQIAVGCALGHLDLRHAARDWRRGRPSLAAWAERLAERPSMAATAPKG